MKVKKIALSIAGGFIGLLLILGLIGVFLGGQGTLDNPESEYYDPRLEELRERSAELDEVYEGKSEMVEPNSDGEDPFASRGELSNFDSFQDDPQEPPQAGAADSESFVSPEEASPPPAPVSEPDSFSGPEPKANDSALVESLQREEPTTSPFDTVQPRAAGIDESDVEAMVSEAVEAAMADVVTKSVLSDRLQALNLQRENLTETIRQSVDEALASRGADELAVSVAELNERIESLETEKQAARRRASQPSANQLRNLYRLEKIAGKSAVLIGQNTGREFTFGEGDTLAYGGTVASIRGDSVTLRWPNTQTTLSIY